MIVLSRNLVLAGMGDTFDHPIVGWQNLVRFGAVGADYEEENYPASNLANSFTHSRWKSDSDSEQCVSVSIFGIQELDYVGIARHNLGSTATPVSVEGASELDSNGDPEWEELTEPAILPDDGPAIFRFEPQSLIGLRLRLQPEASVFPTIAVMYAGKLLVFERRIFVGHNPINLTRVANITNARSETGEFLGRIVRNQRTETSVALRNITSGWYRTEMRPFIEASEEAPFFFAWRPGSYSGDVGYAWMTNNPFPSNQLPNGMMQIDLQMSGVV